MKYLFINEENNESDNFTKETPKNGLHLIPSSILGRNPSVRGFFLTAQTDGGKIGFSDPSNYLSLDELNDVFISNPGRGDQLCYDGEKWIVQDRRVKNYSMVGNVGVLQVNSIRGSFKILDIVVGPQKKFEGQIRSKNSPGGVPSIMIGEYCGEGAPLVYLNRIEEGTMFFTIFNMSNEETMEGNIGLFFNFNH